MSGFGDAKKKDVVDATAIARIEHADVSLGTLHASKPAELVTQATEAATTLASVINDRQLYSMIQGKRYVRCEGWTTLAAMMGVTPHEVETTEKDGVYTSIVEFRRMSDGMPISRASAECGGERPWNTRDNYARRSMAQTRATSKAARMAFSWVMALAGYEVTPAEEMDFVEDRGDSPKSRPRQSGGHSGQSGKGKSGTITEKQAKFLHVLCKKKSADPEATEAAIKSKLGVESFKDIPYAAGKKIIDDMAAKPDHVPAEPEPSGSPEDPTDEDFDPDDIPFSRGPA